MGEGAVGKSALAIQFLRSRFIDEYDPTIEDSYKKVCVIDNEVGELHILDTAGQEAFNAMRESYMRQGEGFLFVYSITSRSSIEELLPMHELLVRIKEGRTANVPIILVGNKCDLEYERQVSMNEGRALARQFGCRFLETSAKERFNVDQAFYDLVREIRRHYRNQQLSRPVSSPKAIPSQATAEIATSKCCPGCVIT